MPTCEKSTTEKELKAFFPLYEKINGTYWKMVRQILDISADKGILIAYKNNRPIDNIHDKLQIKNIEKEDQN